MKVRFNNKLVTRRIPKGMNKILKDFGLQFHIFNFKDGDVVELCKWFKHNSGSRHEISSAVHGFQGESKTLGHPVYFYDLARMCEDIKAIHNGEKDVTGCPYLENLIRKSLIAP